MLFVITTNCLHFRNFQSDLYQITLFSSYALCWLNFQVSHKKHIFNVLLRVH